MPLQIPLPTDTPYNDIAQYVPLLISSIEGFLQARDVWASADYQQAYSYMEDLKAYLVENLPPVIDYATQALHFHLNSIIVNGNAVAWTANAAQPFGYYWRQLPSAINDEFWFYLPLAVGSYHMDMAHAKQAGGGIVNIVFPDGTGEWNVDFYNATTLNDQHTVLPFSVVTAGLKVFKLKVASKNASSSGYTANFTYFSIKP